MSLVAVVALVVSLAVVRQRQEERRLEAQPQPATGRSPAAQGLNLDALRTAGL